jgi:hypothetical protein
MWRRACLCHTPHAIEGLIIPEAFKSVGRHRGVAHGMLNVLVPKIILNGPRIMPLRRKVIAARMPQLVRMGDKGVTVQLVQIVTVSSSFKINILESFL